MDVKRGTKGSNTTRRETRIGQRLKLPGETRLTSKAVNERDGADLFAIRSRSTRSGSSGSNRLRRSERALNRATLCKRYGNHYTPEFSARVNIYIRRKSILQYWVRRFIWSNRRRGFCPVKFLSATSSFATLLFRAETENVIGDSFLPNAKIRSSGAGEKRRE